MVNPLGLHSSSGGGVLMFFVEVLQREDSVHQKRYEVSSRKAVAQESTLFFFLR